MESNVYKFYDLSKEQQKLLLDYIDRNFIATSKINPKHSAYGLKQRYNALHGTETEHVTSECFKEAMEVAGFKSKPIAQGTTPNWNFNVRVTEEFKRPIRHSELSWNRPNP